MTNKKKWVFFGFFTLILLCINIIYPIIHDDLLFKTKAAADISSAFSLSADYGNGRYLGNFMQLFFMSHPVARVILKTALMDIYIILITFITSKKGEFNIKMPMIVFFCTSLYIFSQAIAWNAGFFNYFIPVVFMLFTIYIYQNYVTFNSKARVLSLILIFIIGFAEQLYSEHSTLITVLLALILTICDIKKKQKTLPVSALLLISNAIGTFVMFAGPYLSGLSDKLDYYRSTAIDSGVFGFIKMILSNVYTVSCIVCTFTVVSVILSVIIFSLIKNEKKLRYKLLKIIMFVLPIASVAQYIIGFHYGRIAIGLFIFSFLILLFNIIYYISAMAIIITKYKNNNKAKIIFYFILFICSCGVILPVKPIGARCLWLAYTFLTIAVLMLYNSYKDKIDIKITSKMTKVLSCVLIAACLIYTVLYSFAFYANEQRNECIRVGMEEKSYKIVVPKIPFPLLVWTNGKSTVYERTYYYDTPKEIEFVFIPYKEWTEQYK